jgi:predicted transcriptional regulator
MQGEQIRAARALLSWTASDLAEKSGVSYPTIQRLDATRGSVSGRFSTVETIRKTFEAQGIQFLESGEVAAGVGVALKADGKGI